MTAARARWVLTSAVTIGAIAGTTAAFGAIAPPPAVPKAPVTPECKGIQVCEPHVGPWVLVPATGEVEYLVECKLRSDVVAGTDAPTSAKDIRVTFDAFLGSPFYAKRTPSNSITYGFAIFRAVSIDGHAGAFKPALGCIPRKGGGSNKRSTLTAAAAPVKPKAIPNVPIDGWAKTVDVVPGTSQKGTVGCSSLPVENTKRYEHLVNGLEWGTVALDTPSAPDPKLIAAALSAVHVTVSSDGELGIAQIVTGNGIAQADKPQVQVGVQCAL